MVRLPQNVETIVKHEYSIEYPGINISLWCTLYAMDRMQSSYSNHIECALDLILPGSEASEWKMELNAPPKPHIIRIPSLSDRFTKAKIEKKFFQLEKLRKRIN